jgi:hypothetical protein
MDIVALVALVLDAQKIQIKQPLRDLGSNRKFLRRVEYWNVDDPTKSFGT